MAKTMAINSLAHTGAEHQARDDEQHQGDDENEAASYDGEVAALVAAMAEGGRPKIRC